LRAKPPVFASMLPEQLFEFKNENAIKNLRIFAANVLARCYPSTLSMNRSNLVRRKHCCLQFTKERPDPDGKLAESGSRYNESITRLAGDTNSTQDLYTELSYYFKIRIVRPKVLKI
jgi:hypothetical protein